MKQQEAPLSDLQITGEKIRELRRKQHLTQEQLAEIISEGCSANILSRYENGTTQMGIRALYSIAKALGTTPNELSPDRSRIETTKEEKIASIIKKLTYLSENEIDIMYQLVCRLSENTQTA